MLIFSDRQGYEGKKPLQIDSIDDNLRNGLWNGLDLFFWGQYKSAVEMQISLVNRYFPDQPLKDIVTALWMYHLKLPKDSMPSKWRLIREQLREYYYGCDWFRVYNFIEYLAPEAENFGKGRAQKFVEYCNQVLETEQSAYRFVKGQIVPITNSTEIEEIETAIANPYDAVGTQVRSALSLLADKKNPDYRNCIKEAIGAVETATKLIAGNSKGTLGTVLPELKKLLNLHPAQVEGFLKLYGYTSDDESGIRHGMMDKDDVTSDDARYMLVICSAFSNYLLRLADRAGIKPGKGKK